MTLTIGLLLALSVLATTSPQASTASQPQTDSGDRMVNRESPISVTIATGGGLFGPAKDRYRVDEAIPVTITMTNTSNQPEYTCITGPLYQDLPILTKGDQLVPYMAWQSYELSTAERNGTCLEESLPETILLKPHEERVVDWFVLSDYEAFGADAWYDQLSPGDYQLSLQRRFGCCEGAMVDSNKINFEVVP
jgi:hypothetical protein